MIFVVSGGDCPMSCLGLGLVRWPVVSVPTVLDVQGGFSAWVVRGHNSVGLSQQAKTQVAVACMFKFFTCTLMCVVRNPAVP